MDPNKQLIEFVNSLPVGPRYTPIYAKGVVYGVNSIISKGKNPHEHASSRHFAPSDVALCLDKEPDKFVAIGLYTGIASQGLVILDVDANLATLLDKWGESLQDAPKIISTKVNAAKYVFRVPEDQRSQVKGFGLSHTGLGYEVLWGKQGVIAGTYPGSSDGLYPPGSYTLESGDFSQIPEAPAWLLAEMREKYAQNAPTQATGLVKNRKGLDFSGRTSDEVAEIIRDCLTVLPLYGRGSEDDWWIVGAMIAEELPNDLGLTLWSAWSAEDPDYEEDWKKGDPCADKWPSIVSKAGQPGNAGLGSLIKLADKYDPERQRFQDTSRETLNQVESSQVQRFQQVAMTFDELKSRAKSVMQIDNPAEQNYAMHRLAVESGFREAEKVERLMVDQLTYEKNTDAVTLDQLLDMNFERNYLIPDLLATPSVILMYGSGGDGKSMAAWTIAKHVATGSPFKIRGKNVPVQKGGVLILNGDQPLIQVQEQLEEVDIPRGADITIRSDFQLQRYMYFVKQIEQYKPKLVIIDSLIGCSGGKSFDENKSDFATPLYWLTRNNGNAFPATTIIVIHHANKAGQFRGTTAVRDAVDEVISLKKPDDKQIEQVGRNTRILTFEKSRTGRGGSQLVMRQEADLTYCLEDWTPEVDNSDTSPASVHDRVLMKLRACAEAGQAAMTVQQLYDSQLCGSSKPAIRKSVQRHLKKKLIAAAGLAHDPRTGKLSQTYIGVIERDLTRVVVGKSCPTTQKTSGGTGCDVGQGGGQKGVVLSEALPVSSHGPDQVEIEDNFSAETGLSHQDPLQQQESALRGQLGTPIRAREELTDDPLELFAELATDLDLGAPTGGDC